MDENLSHTSMSSMDTPIHRATLNRLSVEEQEAILDALRERRLLARQKVEKIAKVKTEKADLSAYLKFERLLKVVQKDAATLDKAIVKQEASVHKLRALIVEMGVQE